MVAYTSNSSTRKGEAVESAVPGHLRLHRKFKVRNFEKEKGEVFLMGQKPKYLLESLPAHSPQRGQALVFMYGVSLNLYWSNLYLQ